MLKRKPVKICTLLLLLLLAGAAAGCALFETGETLAAPAEELDGRLVRANNNLGFDVFHELRQAENENGNIFISPASILTALAMTYNGAGGDTRDAMEDALHLRGMSTEEVNTAFAALLTILQNPDPEVELALANSLWGREGFEFKDDFLQRSREYFKAEIEALDFSDPGATDLINNWVKEQTREAIKEIVEPPIDPDTVLFLINAIYFNGLWSEPFDPELTADLPFYLSDGSEIKHPLMIQAGEFSYLENEFFQAVRLPYGKNGRVSMYLFLPLDDAAGEDFYGKLGAETWREWVNSFWPRDGEIGLPRFGFEYETSLNETLKNLGMGIAFDEDNADFSAMRPIPPNLFISDVKHKSFIEVNEEGTEAAAVTSVEVRVTSAPETTPFRMIADRPFFFAIADDLTGSILFMGSVADPR